MRLCRVSSPAMRAPTLLALLLVGCDRTSPQAAPPPAASPTATPSTLSTAPPSPSPAGAASGASPNDVFETDAGPVKVHPVLHATLWLEIGKKIVWVDPWSKGKLDGPKADVVLITDIHQDHFDEPGLAAVRRPESTVVG